MRTMNPRVRGTVVVLGALLTVAIALAVSPITASTEAQGTKTTTAATAPKAGVATAALSTRARRTHVVAGRRAVVTGVLRPAEAGKVVTLQRRGRHGWRTVTRDRTNRRGGYRLSFRPRRPGSALLRVRFGGDAHATAARKGAGRLNVYRRAFASWYGPGLYGQKLGCGGTLTPGTIGVAHKTLPCGTRLTLRYRGRTVRARVIDRGPYVGGREFDLTAATKQRLGFGSTGFVLSTR
ncbi:MAG: rare lipoprotein [Frankiaceae bacterium]|nr:rare lipoprotein [Frankiaceae bacterium]